MSLVLRNLGHHPEGRRRPPIDMELKPGQLNVLLGATGSGKTSLMRLMAGLEKPVCGSVWMDGNDVTHVPVRKRNVAMVYQQFINYPSLNTFDNIASPLKLKGLSREVIRERVHALADRLGLTPMLARLPAELSGGQQQRVALARALAKEARLILLDEPLVNLDYKLRETLRDELTHIFTDSDAVVVYATTEPAEALLLGGQVAVMADGRVLQHGPTGEVYRRPASLAVARAFSDPQINVIACEADPHAIKLPGGLAFPNPVPDSPVHHVGIMPHALRIDPLDDDLRVGCDVSLAEIAGSETYLHLDGPLGELVCLVPGVFETGLGSRITLGFAARDCLLFNRSGDLLETPFDAAPLNATPAAGRRAH
ncbi:MAG: ABC transporter ATP-binding protein [Rhodocyclaceae bacterium]